MTERPLKLMDAMKLDKHEGVLVHNPSNIFYLSGYTGEGLVLIARGVWAIVTDFRYTEAAEKQSPDFVVKMTDKSLTHDAIVNKLCREHGIDTLYYEDDYLTVRAFEECKAAIAGVEWKSLNGAVQRQREIKDETEIALMAKACELTGEAFERILPTLREGMTEKEIALNLEFDMLSHGATGIAFSTIVAAGANGSLPHAVPGDYRLRKGDMVTMDFGAKFGGYCADMTRTIALGEPSAEMRKVYETVLAAQRLAQDAVMEGKNCHDIDAIARDYIYQHGYEGRFGHGLGHCVGIDIHENPRFSMLCNAITKENMVITVEPGIYLPGIGGVRIENSVVVKKEGCVSLTKPSCELIIL
ncbi:MAG: Xaa-Pro peptidase family protein [Eubacteriales bacterium]|nr:Xaa-Pro peptidase family protein [Eubacteriales bacterium]